MARRVLFIVSTLKRCGPVGVIFGIVKHLDPERYEAAIVTLSPEPSESDAANFRAMGVPIFALNKARWAIPATMEGIRRTRRSTGADIVHCHGIRPDFFVALARISAPSVSTIHSDLTLDYTLRYGPLTGRSMALSHFAALRGFRSVAAVSDGVRRRAERHGIHATTIENGIDLETYRPPRSRQAIERLRAKFGWPLDKLVVLHASQFVAVKRVVQVVRGFLRSQLSSRAILVLAGDGPERGACEKVAAGASNVLFLGNRPDICLLMAAADVAISASSSEGFALSVSEACASGLRVLASFIPFHRRMFELFPRQVILFDYDGPGSIAQALDEHVRARRDPFAVCEPSRTLISSRRMSEQYQSLYDCVCGEPR